MIFETGQVNDLKINEDFILVHKNLFEYLYGIYGCDYFIQAKQFKVQTQKMSHMGSISPDLKNGPSTHSSTQNNQMQNADINSHASFVSGTSGSSSWNKGSMGYPAYNGANG
jgi:hypothetical protein